LHGLVFVQLTLAAEPVARRIRVTSAALYELMLEVVPNVALPIREPRHLVDRVRRLVDPAAVALVEVYDNVACCDVRCARIVALVVRARPGVEPPAFGSVERCERVPAPPDDRCAFAHSSNVGKMLAHLSRREKYVLAQREAAAAGGRVEARHGTGAF